MFIVLHPGIGVGSVGGQDHGDSGLLVKTAMLTLTVGCYMCLTSSDFSVRAAEMQELPSLSC